MPESPLFVRYAVYTRQSVATDSDLSSCDAQFEFCRDAAKRRWGPYGIWHGERYDDVGVSGADARRPALDRLMERVRARELQQVVIYRLDRLARNVRECLNTLYAFKEHGVDLFIATAPELGLSATDDFLLNTMASFAEFEREMIRSRIADARQAQKRRGRRIAGRLPYGYDADPLTRQLVVNRDEAKRVRTIFNMAAKGILPSKIAAEVNRLGWRTKRTVAKRSGKASGGRPWTPRQVLSLLSNPVYVGAFSDGDEVRFGLHEPIVTQETFQRAGKQVKLRRTAGPRRSKEEMLRALEWPLRGRVICSQCGRPMSTHETRRKTRLYRHYRCRSHAGGRPPCRGSGLPAYELEKTVAERLADPDLVEGIPDTSDDDRRFLHYLQVGYALLDHPNQMRMMSWLIKEVTYDQSDSTLAVTLDMEIVRAILKDSPKNWPFLVRNA